ncbi:MAG: hypothetical protein K5739_11160, partial [Lachnospiraceae bacterium]|nr:hypothetical protein [Lachnospiraceae bacterium]
MNTEKQEKKTTTDMNLVVTGKTVKGRTVYLREAEAAVQENMPPVYLVGQDILDSRKAVGDDDNDLVADSAEMKDVKNKIMMIQAFLSNPMPPFAVKPQDEEAYKKELESVKLAMSMMYNKLLSSMDTWLEKKDALSDYTKERSELIEKLKTQVLEEESLFAQSMTEYRQSMTGSEFAKNGKSQTWAEMLRYQRAEKIDLDTMKKKVQMVGGGTSSVLKIDRNGKNVYFRAEEGSFVGNLFDMIDALSLHFPGINAKAVDAFSDAVEEELNEHSLGYVYRDFYDLYHKKDLYSGLRKKSGTPIAMFLANVPKKYRKQFGEYFSLIFKTFNQQGISELSAHIPQGRNLTRRNVATSRLASLMGIGDMFAESRTAVVKKDGKLFTGNLMEDAQGLDVDEVAAKSLKYSSAAEDQLLILPIFDLLCGQVDRNYGNFMYSTGSSEITGIRCIDNDMSFGLLSFTEAQKGVNKLRRLTPAALHALPSKFKKAIMAMDGTLMRLILRDLLEPDELDSLENRLLGLQDALEHAEAFYSEKNDKLSADKKRLAEDPEMIKLTYFEELSSAANIENLEIITNFYRPLFS